MTQSKESMTYSRLREEYPNIFANPPSASIEILNDPTDVEAAEEAARRKLIKQRLPVEWSETGIVFEDQYHFVLRDPVRFRSGALGTYFRFIPTHVENPGVAILPVYNGRIVLVRHFRHATRSWHLEIPRGFGDTGSTAEESAHREIREEITGDCGSLVSLGGLHTNTGATSEYVSLFFAELRSYSSVLEDDEAIDEITEMEVEDLLCRVREGDVTDSFTIAALFRAMLNKLLP